MDPQFILRSIRNDHTNTINTTALSYHVQTPVYYKNKQKIFILIIFIIKIIGGINIYPGIAISIHDKGTLRVEIKTPDLTG